MALVQFGGGVASMSGSLGGTTFARNRGGAYARNRVVPVDPGSSFQSLVRSLLSNLVNIWAETLTAAQRLAWESYAEAVPLPNALGDPRNVGGIGMFVRGNLVRGQVGYTHLPLVSDGPTILSLSAFTPPAVVGIVASSDTASISFDNTDAWANEDNAALAIYASRPKNAGVNFFKGPYRFAEKVLGDSVTAPTSPVAVSLPFPVEVGQKVFFKCNVYRADGRAGTDFRFHGTAS